MTALYGYLENERGSIVTKAANRIITATVQNRTHRLELTLRADGSWELVRKIGSPAEGYYNGVLVDSGSIEEAPAEALKW